MMSTFEQHLQKHFDKLNKTPDSITEKSDVEQQPSKYSTKTESMMGNVMKGIYNTGKATAKAAYNTGRKALDGTWANNINAAADSIEQGNWGGAWKSLSPSKGNNNYKPSPNDADNWDVWINKTWNSMKPEERDAYDNDLAKFNQIETLRAKRNPTL